MPALPARPSLSQIRKQAKTLRKLCSDADQDALLRVGHHFSSHSKTGGQPLDISLRDAQRVVAREYGFDSWSALRQKVETEAGKDDFRTIRQRRMKEQTTSQDEIVRIIEAATGSGVETKQRLTDGFSCETYWITTNDGQDVMFRANWYNRPNTPHFVSETWGLDLLAKHGIPGPRRLYTEHELPGHPRKSVVVNTRVQGIPLKQLIDQKAISDSERDRLLEEAGNLLGRIHSISADRFSRVLYPEGLVYDEDWSARYWNSLDLDRLQESATNAELPWSIVEEGLAILNAGVSLGDDIAPKFLHGDFVLDHIIIHDDAISGLIDFERCIGGDPAEEAGWDGSVEAETWWTAFTEETPTPLHTGPLLAGYRQTAVIDESFSDRAKWHRFRNRIGGLCYHGVNDVNTAGMMDFLNWRYRQDLEEAKQVLGT